MLSLYRLKEWRILFLKRTLKCLRKAFPSLQAYILMDEEILIKALFSEVNTFSLITNGFSLQRSAE